MTDVPLKDHIDREIDAVRELLTKEVTHERELREGSERNAQLQLEKQAREYERRLTDLNHAHQMALADKATFLSRETYEIAAREAEKWKLEISKEMAAESGRQGEKARNWALVAGFAASILTAIVTGLIFGRIRIP